MFSVRDVLCMDVLRIRKWSCWYCFLFAKIDTGTAKLSKHWKKQDIHCKSRRSKLVRTCWNIWYRFQTATGNQQKILYPHNTSRQLPENTRDAPHSSKKHSSQSSTWSRTRLYESVLFTLRQASSNVKCKPVVWSGLLKMIQRTPKLKQRQYTKAFLPNH